MVTRKKAKSKARRKKVPARKAATRKKTARVKRKAAVRPAAPEKKPATHPAPAPKAKPVTPQPARPVAAAAAPAPLAGEERIGVVTHYYTHISVAVVRMESGSLRLGDTIHIMGHTSDFRQRVESMQIEHKLVPEIRAGQEFGLKVTGHAREHDVVYKVTDR